MVYDVFCYKEMWHNLTVIPVCLSACFGHQQPLTCKTTLIGNVDRMLNLKLVTFKHQSKGVYIHCYSLFSNGQSVEGADHQNVVQLIRQSVDAVDLVVISVSEEEARRLEPEGGGGMSAMDYYERRSVPISVPDTNKQKDDAGKEYVVYNIYLASRQVSSRRYREFDALHTNVSPQSSVVCVCTHSCSFFSASTEQSLYSRGNSLVYPLNISSQYILSVYPLSISSQYILSVYPLNIPSQYILSLYPLPIPSQYIFSVYPLSISSQYILSVYPLSISSQYILSVYPLSIPSQYILSVYPPSISSQYTLSVYPLTISSQYILSVYW